MGGGMTPDPRNDMYIKIIIAVAFALVVWTLYVALNEKYYPY
jgi:hypothetical protein